MQAGETALIDAKIDLGAAGLPQSHDGEGTHVGQASHQVAGVMKFEIRQIATADRRNVPLGRFGADIDRTNV
jgi:hypothetical protein